MVYYTYYNKATGKEITGTDMYNLKKATGIDVTGTRLLSPTEMLIIQQKTGVSLTTTAPTTTSAGQVLNPTIPSNVTVKTTTASSYTNVTAERQRLQAEAAAKKASTPTPVVSTQPQVVTAPTTGKEAEKVNVFFEERGITTAADLFTSVKSGETTITASPQAIIIGTTRPTESQKTLAGLSQKNAEAKAFNEEAKTWLEDYNARQVAKPELNMFEQASAEAGRLAAGYQEKVSSAQGNVTNIGGTATAVGAAGAAFGLGVIKGVVDIGVAVTKPKETIAGIVSTVKNPAPLVSYAVKNPFTFAGEMTGQGIVIGGVAKTAKDFVPESPTRVAKIEEGKVVQIATEKGTFEIASSTSKIISDKKVFEVKAGAVSKTTPVTDTLSVRKTNYAFDIKTPSDKIMVGGGEYVGTLNPEKLTEKGLFKTTTQVGKNEFVGVAGESGSKSKIIATTEEGLNVYKSIGIETESARVKLSTPTTKFETKAVVGDTKPSMASLGVYKETAKITTEQGTKTLFDYKNFGVGGSKTIKEIGTAYKEFKGEPFEPAKRIGERTKLESETGTGSIVESKLISKEKTSPPVVDLLQKSRRGVSLVATAQKAATVSKSIRVGGSLVGLGVISSRATSATSVSTPITMNKPAQSTKSFIITSPKAKTSVFTATKSKSSLTFGQSQFGKVAQVSKTNQFSGLINAQKPAINIKTLGKVTTSQAQEQKQSTEQMLLQKTVTQQVTTQTPSAPFAFKVPAQAKGFRMPDFDNLDMPMAKSNRKLLSQPKEYKPSVTAIVFNIKGKASQAGVTTGLGLRPIQVKKLKIGRK